ncbi:MAG TPA: CHASE domain-containing protein [Pyrinomonadaceae bacterium]|nr:CHASE domain-containing protein [Pyrinomonadaceae bacterium]
MRRELSPEHDKAGRAWIPYFVLAVTLLLTAAAAYSVAQKAEAKARLQFEGAVRETRGDIKYRLDNYISLLNSASGLFAASDDVTWRDFHDYAEHLQLREQYRGVQGIGFSARIAPDKVDALVAEMRRQGARDFRITPDAPARDEYHAIIYIEPQDRRNIAVVGYDMFTEAVRRAAMERARDTGAPAASGRVTLRQELDEYKQAGFLIYVPVYRRGVAATTTEERRAALRGFVYSPFRADDLLEGIIGAQRSAYVNFRIYDGETESAENLLHDSTRNAALAATAPRTPSEPPHFTNTSQLDIAGRRWTLAFTSRPELDLESGRGQLPYILLGGLVVSFVLFALTRAQARARAAAERAATGLRQSEIRFRTLIEQSPLSTQIFSPDGRTVQVNRAWEQLWGVTLDALGDYNVLTDAQLVEKGIMPFIKQGFNGTPTAIPPILYDPEATIPNVTTNENPQRWVQAIIYPVKDADGKIREVVLVHEDITERKRAEENLRYQLSLTSTITENTAEGLCLLDAEGRLTFMNPAAEAILGWKEAELKGRVLHDAVHYLKPDGSPFPMSECPLIEVLNLKAPITNREDMWVRKDGTMIPIFCSCAPIVIDGKVTGAVLAAHDITERKRAEANRARLARQTALRADVSVTLAENKTLPAILQHCVEALVRHLDAAYARIWTLNPDTRSLELQAVASSSGNGGNSAGTHANGSHAPVGQYKLDLIAAERRPHLTNDVASDPPPGDPAWAEREGIVAFAGYPLLVEERLIGVLTMFSRARLTEDALDALALVSDAIAQGIERKRLEEQLRRRAEQLAEANRLKDEFLATLSHELRTPLTSILGWAKLMRTESFDPQMSARALQIIERSAVAQSQLINDLLDVSRIITGKLRLVAKPVELAPIINATVDSLRPTADARGVLLEVSLDTETGRVSGDADRLQQVIWNLLSNAIKFTPKAGRVSVRLQRTDSQAEIVVSDSGQGIKADFLPYIFDRFRQADGSITREHGGLGLGLSIVRHLVELHGGTIRAESDGPERGSTFRVRLPLMALRGGADGRGAHSGATGASVAVAANARDNLLAGLRILVVDDDEDTRALLVTTLEQSGAESVEAAASASDALGALRRLAPDVLVSDIGMPGVDGYELIRQIRALPPESGGRVPAAALTAYAAPDDRQRALDAGYDLHISKPVEPSELTAAVARLAGR